MRFRYCEQCGKDTAHQRALGIGTLLACFLTLGLWLLVIPFYPTRCRHCGTAKWAAIDSSDWLPRKDDPEYQEKLTNRLIAVIFIIVLLLLVIFLPKTRPPKPQLNFQEPVSQSFQKTYKEFFGPPQNH